MKGPPEDGGVGCLCLVSGCSMEMEGPRDSCDRTGNPSVILEKQITEGFPYLLIMHISREISFDFLVFVSDSFLHRGTTGHSE